MRQVNDKWSGNLFWLEKKQDLIHTLTPKYYKQMQVFTFPRQCQRKHARPSAKRFLGEKSTSSGGLPQITYLIAADARGF